MALIKSVRGFTPKIGKDTFLADNATIIGDVEIGEGCSIWFGTVLRGDVNSIRIGNGVNVRALINPNIRVNGLIQLDQASVYRTALSNNDISMAGGQITDQNTDGNITLSGTTAQPASIATDGVYIVRGIMYTGDTRGQAW